MKICENETFVNSRKIRTNSLFQTNYEENTDSDCFIKCEVVKYTNKFKENCTRHYKFDYMALDYWKKKKKKKKELRSRSGMEFWFFHRDNSLAHQKHIMQ